MLSHQDSQNFKKFVFSRVALIFARMFKELPQTPLTFHTPCEVLDTDLDTFCCFVEPKCSWKCYVLEIHTVLRVSIKKEAPGAIRSDESLIFNRNKRSRTYSYRKLVKKGIHL